MNVFKKAAALALAISICAGFGGCGKKEIKIDTLTWFVPANELTDKAAVIEEINKITEEKIGVKLNIETFDTGSYGQKMRMKMASGDSSFDLMFVGYLSSYAEAVDNEVLEPLTELIDKNAPELKESIDEYIWKDCEYDGEIYAVPNVQIEALQYCYGIQTVLAEKYGWTKTQIDSPKEIEEFLAKVKAGEPDIYPYRPNYGTTMWMLNNYESVTGNVVTHVGDGAKKAVLSFDTPELKEGAETLRAWFEKGYIRSDVASVGDDNTDFNANRYAVNSFTWKPGVEALYPNYTFVKVGKPFLKNGATQATMTGINYRSPNKEKAIKLISLMNTDKELYNLVSLGIKDKHYTVDSDGKYAAIKDSGYGIPAWEVGNQFNGLVNVNQDNDVWEKTKEFNDQAVKSPLSGFIFDDTNVKSQLSSISAIVGEYSAMQNGSINPQDYWDTMLSRFDGAGMKDILSEAQKQLDEFWSKKQ